MELGNLTYFILLIASISVPLALSFDKKVQFYKKLNYIFPAILITAAIFILWDIYFTEVKIWSFNHTYTIGIDLMGLPVEEWLFFLVVPYCCVFIYEVLKVYLDRHEYEHWPRAISLLLVVSFALISFYFRQLHYTAFTFLLSSIYLGYTVFRKGFGKHFTKFYLCYVVSLVPFTFVNGILTSLPVVEYNSAHILNIRILNIPVEDFSYFFLMLLMVITIYEHLKERRYY